MIKGKLTCLTISKISMASEDIIQKVWEKAKIIANKDPNIWRQDQCGAWIYRGHYGNTDSEHGWVIDHITPVSHGGTNNLSNLRPLQWKNSVLINNA